STCLAFLNLSPADNPCKLMALATATATFGPMQFSLTPVNPSRYAEVYGRHPQNFQAGVQTVLPINDRGLRLHSTVRFNCPPSTSGCEERPVLKPVSGALTSGTRITFSSDPTTASVRFTAAITNRDGLSRRSLSLQSIEVQGELHFEMDRTGVPTAPEPTEPVMTTQPPPSGTGSDRGFNRGGRRRMPPCPPLARLSPRMQTSFLSSTKYEDIYQYAQTYPGCRVAFQTLSCSALNSGVEEGNVAGGLLLAAPVLLGWAIVAVLPDVDDVEELKKAPETTIAAALGWCAAGLHKQEGERTFYRGVSQEEAAQIQLTGRLEVIEGGVEVKYLTNTLEAASRWGLAPLI
ncbi:MAG: hypothetical protein ACRD7E_00705, partial [Bryobacteraceae bacterium]